MQKLPPQQNRKRQDRETGLQIAEDVSKKQHTGSFHNAGHERDPFHAQSRQFRSPLRLSHDDQLH